MKAASSDYITPSSQCLWFLHHWTIKYAFIFVMSSLYTANLGARHTVAANGPFLLTQSDHWLPSPILYPFCLHWRHFQLRQKQWEWFKLTCVLYTEEICHWRSWLTAAVSISPTLVARNTAWPFFWSNKALIGSGDFPTRQTAFKEQYTRNRVWYTFRDATVDITDNINKFTAVALTCKTTEAAIPKTTVKSFYNQIPWITRTI